MNGKIDAKLDEEGKQFIVWAKKQGKRLDWIQEKLLEYGLIEISAGRISQIWKANGRSRKYPNENPYAENMVEDKDDEFGDEIEDVTKKIERTLNITKTSVPSNVLQRSLIEDKTLETEDINMSEDDNVIIDIKAILKTSGLKPIKQTQLSEMFEMTDQTPSELARVLDIGGISYTLQKQILTQAYGLDYSNKILAEKKTGKSGYRQPNENMSQTMTQATSLLNQKLRAKQTQIAYEEVDNVLKRLDDNTKGTGSEDPLKIAKDIAALKLITGGDEKLSSKITEALVDNALKKNDNAILDGIKLVMEMNKGNKTGDESSTVSLYQKELSEMRKENQSTTNQMMQRLLDLQMTQMDTKSKSDEKMNDQLRALEKEKMELLASTLKEKVEGSIRSPEEWMAHMHNMIETSKSMGLVPKDGVVDQEQAASIERLKTAENLIDSLPDKVNDGVTKALDRVENTLIKFLEFQEKREQRQDNNQMVRGQPRTSPRTIRTQSDRMHILNTIETQVDNLELKRKKRDEMRNLY